MNPIFALIPAAGRSRRMQSHKLLLPLGARTVIECVLDALSPVVERVFVLVRSDDSALQAAISAHGGAAVVIARHDPPDMRASVELLLGAVEHDCRPGPSAGWLLTPADHPVIHAEVVQTLVGGFRRQPLSIHLPTYQGKGGHPTIFPWGLAERVREIPRNEGLNSLRRLSGIETVLHPTENPSVLWDIDTPADYQQLVRSIASRP